MQSLFMTMNPEAILSILDHNCDTFKFPMLDNGYVYLASTRLSIYRSKMDWAMVIEVFGFSPRAGIPDISVQTFASRLHNRRLPEDYVNREAYERYLASNRNNEYLSVFPIQEGSWQTESIQFVAEGASEIILRDQAIPLPNISEYARHGIELEQANQVHVFELCRFLADIEREKVLATPTERRFNILPEMEQIMQLEEWHHPNVVDDDERPSNSETFQQLAQVLTTGDTSLYKPSQPPNTHWRNWPRGGRL